MIIQNNMEFSYSGPAIYSKEELPQELKNIDRYASYQYGDYSLSKNWKRLIWKAAVGLKLQITVMQLWSSMDMSLHLLTYIQ